MRGLSRGVSSVRWAVAALLNENIDKNNSAAIIKNVMQKMVKGIVYLRSSSAAKRWLAGRTAPMAFM